MISYIVTAEEYYIVDLALAHYEKALLEAKLKSNHVDTVRCSLRSRKEYIENDAY